MSAQTDKYITSRLVHHVLTVKKIIKESDYDVAGFGLFLKGSQNYGLNTPTSDIDSVFIYIPSLMSVVLNKRITFQTHDFTDGDKTQFLDIRDFLRGLLDSNPQYLKLLFTPYFLLSDKHIAHYLSLSELRNDLAYANPSNWQKSILGQAHGYWSSIKKPGTPIADRNKKFMHLCRLHRMLEEYQAGTNYSRILTLDDHEELAKIRTNPDIIHEIYGLNYQDPQIFHDTKDLTIADPEDLKQSIIEIGTDILFPDKFKGA